MTVAAVRNNEIVEFIRKYGGIEIIENFFQASYIKK